MTVVWPRKQARRVSQREAIMRAEELHLEPRHVQEAYWLKRNLDRRRRRSRSEVAIGSLTDELLSPDATRAATHLQQIAQAWRKVIPAAHLPRMRVDLFSKGCLHVTLDASLRFIYQRSMAGDVLAALNSQLTGIRVERIQYRFGSVEIGPGV